MGKSLIISVQHASLQWLVHVLFGSLATLAGPWPTLVWLGLLSYVAVQTRALGWLRQDMRAGVLRRAWPTATLAHAPGLLLSVYLLATFLHLLGDRQMLMVLLQWWTAAWNPLLWPLPPVGRRNLYVWVTLAIPMLEWSVFVIAAGAGQRAHGPGAEPRGRAVRRA